VSIGPFTKEYLELLAHGDQERWVEFRAHFAACIWIAMQKRGIPRDWIPDICQETFARVFKDLREAKVHTPAALPGYVRQTAINVMRETLRDRRRHGEGTFGEAPETADPAMNQEQVFVTDDHFRRIVELLLEDLSAADRELVRMVFLEERERRAVCEFYRITPEILRVRLCRALGRLRAAFAERLAAQPGSGGSLPGAGLPPELVRNRRKQAPSGETPGL
jgi:RNA polymerase sigma factor (sigma-70 family)